MRQRLLSRVADSVYWMARYVERAENVARLIDVTVQLMLDASAGAPQQWQPIVETSGDSALFAKRYGTATRQSVIEFLTFDEANPNSIVSCLRAARENARSVRDTISSEMWQEINNVYLMIMAEAATRGPKPLVTLYHDLKVGCGLFQGITDSTMSHNEAWMFIKLGQAVERADKTSRILDVKYFLLLPAVQDVGTSIDDVQWSAVLRSVSGFEMYRKRHGRIRPTDVVQFLLLDREFPRAVRFCVGAAVRALYAITETPENTFTNPTEQHAMQLRAELDYAQVNDILAKGLHEFLDGLQVRLNRFHDEVHSLFFAMRPLQSQAQSQGQSQSQTQSLAAPSG